MFKVIESYRVKMNHADNFVHLLEAELIPILCAVPEFSSYEVLMMGPQAIVFIGAYRSRGAADSAARAAAGWAATRVGGMTDGPARITVGEVRMSASIARDAPETSLSQHASM